MFGSGVLGSLLPLRFSAKGMSAGVIGLIATAEALGFLSACLYAHKIIAPVGLERAYATFAGLKAVAILGLHFADNIVWLVLLRFLIGMNAAGLAIIVESWLNALVPNAQRGRVLTIYVLTYGLFFGTGQLFGQNLNVLGPEMLFIAGIATTLALVPMVAIDVRAPVLPHGVKLQIAKALRTSPVSVLACLLNGLILASFTTVGPLFGERIGLGQSHIVMLMACVSLGGLFLQWPIGYISDKVDRLYALIGLGSGIVAVAFVLATASRSTPLIALAALFAVFGIGRLRRVVLNALVRLGARRGYRTHHRNLRDPTDQAGRLFCVRDCAHVAVHPVRAISPQSARQGSGGGDARGFSGLSADLARDLRLATLPSRSTGRAAWSRAAQRVAASVRAQRAGGVMCAVSAFAHLSCARDGAMIEVREDLIRNGTAGVLRSTLALDCALAVP
jgi:MFS family permease